MGSEEEKDNSLADVRRFLDTPENPVTMQEFAEFWKGLTDEEKEDFKKGLPSKSE